MHTNITFGQPIALYPGLATSFFLAGYNTNGNQTFNGVIYGPGSIERQASGGNTILNAQNTYTGPTTVGGGTLFINGGINSPVAVAGGTLGGTGTILGAVIVQSDSTLAPGFSGIGTLTISNTLTFQAGSTNYVEVNKTASTSDLVTGLTSVTYGGTLVVTNLSGTLAGGDSFQLFSATSYSGSFASIIPAVPGTGLQWDTSMLTHNGTLRIAVVPQPVINSIGIQNGTNLVFSGTYNGKPSNGYSVLSSTNVALPLTNWVLELSGTFNGSGAFNVTNPFSKGTPQKFYLISVP